MLPFGAEKQFFNKGKSTILKKISFFQEGNGKKKCRHIIYVSNETFFNRLSTGIFGPDNLPSKPRHDLVQAGDL